MEDLKAKAEETLEFATVRLPSLKEECTVGAMLADFDLPASAGSDISWFTVFPAKTRQ